MDRQTVFTGSEFPCIRFCRSEVPLSLIPITAKYLRNARLYQLQAWWKLSQRGATNGALSKSVQKVNRQCTVTHKKESRSRSLYAVARPSVVCLSVVCRLSVTLVHPTQAVEIFGNISTALGTLAIR